MKSLIQRMVELPQYVYHYCSYDVGIKILQSSELKMSSPCNVNDNLEFTCSGYSNVSIEGAKANLMNLFSIAREQGLAPNDEVAWKKYIDPLPESELVLIKDMLESGEFNAIRRFHLQKEMGRYFCFFCFSESHNSSEMLCKYANNSRGISIAFDTSYFPDLGKVSYLPSRPLLPFVRMDKEFSEEEASEFVNKLIFTKTSEWSEEREWRIVRNISTCTQRNNGVFLQIDPKSIRKIYFGKLVQEDEVQAFQIQVHNNYPDLEYFRLLS